MELGYTAGPLRVEGLKCKGSMQDISLKLRVFIEDEMRSCSMDICGITPLYVYRYWGGTVPFEEIEKALEEYNDKRKRR